MWKSRKSAHPPLWQTCKVLRPWALFRETTVYAFCQLILGVEILRVDILGVDIWEELILLSYTKIVGLPAEMSYLRGYALYKAHCAVLKLEVT